MWFLKIYLKKLHTFNQSKENWSLKQNNFDDILETKKDFLDYKNKDLEKSKNYDFFEGVSPSLIKKLKIFHLFLLRKINQENKPG